MANLRKLLQGGLNNKQDRMKRQEFFEMKLESEEIDTLDIYWFDTIDNKNNDLPGYVEGLLIQRFYELYGRLPEWNKDF